MAIKESVPTHTQHIHILNRIPPPIIIVIQITIKRDDFIFLCKKLLCLHENWMLLFVVTYNDACYELNWLFVNGTIGMILAIVYGIVVCDAWFNNKSMTNKWPQSLPLSVLNALQLIS